MALTSTYSLNDLSLIMRTHPYFFITISCLHLWKLTM